MIYLKSKFDIGQNSFSKLSFDILNIFV